MIMSMFLTKIGVGRSKPPKDKTPLDKTPSDITPSDKSPWFASVGGFNPTWSTLTWSTCYFTTYPIWSTLSLPNNISMASWILGYGFMLTCSVMPIWPLFEFI